jgi:hypothetical protein
MRTHRSQYAGLARPGSPRIPGPGNPGFSVSRSVAVGSTHPYLTPCQEDA